MWLSGCGAISMCMAIHPDKSALGERYAQNDTFSIVGSGECIRHHVGPNFLRLF